MNSKKRRKKMEIDRIYQGDCIEGMRQIQDCSVDLIVTDPPYRLTQRGSSGTMSGYWASDITKKGKVFEKNDIEIEDYIDEFYRILKDDAHCYIMTNNFNICHFLDVISRSRFHFVKCLIWDKGNKICGKYYMGQYEYVIFIRKGKDKPINDCGCSDILFYPNKKTKLNDGTNLHDSEKPVGLMSKLIENSTAEGELILDPFMGSGTSAIAAIRTRRHFLGFELDEEYFSRASERIENELAEPGLF